MPGNYLLSKQRNDFVGLGALKGNAHGVRQLLQQTRRHVRGPASALVAAAGEHGVSCRDRSDEPQVRGQVGD